MPFLAGTDGTADVSVTVSLARDEAVAVGITQLAPVVDVVAAQLPAR
jgi:hypothetical protein